MIRNLGQLTFGASLLCLFSLSTHAQTISLNFAADEPNGTNEANIESGEPAGILGSTEWNNLSLNWGPQDELGNVTSAQLIGEDGELTTAEVLWDSQNTWASIGRGDEVNVTSETLNGDYFLMQGYLDSNDAGAFCDPGQFNFLGDWCGGNRVIVSNLPYTNFDVIVYMNGGVQDRGGKYQLTEASGPRDAVYWHDTGPFTGQFDLAFEEREVDGGLATVYTGDVMIFEDVVGDGFTLDTHALAIADGLGGETLGFRTSINGIEIVPKEVTEFEPCDFDQNNVCDIVDLDNLMYNGLGTADAAFDLNNDNTVDLADRDSWLRAAGSLPGDANLDGQNNAQDLNAVGSHWVPNNTGITTWADGDYDGNGTVDAGDLNTLGSWWTKTAADFATPDAAPIPEPNTAVLTLFGLLGLLAIRQRN